MRLTGGTLFAAAVLAMLLSGCAPPTPSVHDPNAAAMQETITVAEAGDPVAQTVVGTMFEAGVFGDPDPYAAALWYDKAAQQGDPLAAFYLAGLFEDGRGVERDYLSAANLYRRSAQAGHGSAAFKLGYLYEKGLGVEQDFVAARTWYDVAQQGWLDGGINPFLPAYLEASADPDVVDAGLPVAVPQDAGSDLAVSSVAPAGTVETASLNNAFHVHLGSEKTVEAAMAQWQDLRVRFESLLGAYTPALAKLQLAGGATYYQILAGPLTAESDADVLCAQLQPKGQYCNPIPPTG